MDLNGEYSWTGVNKRSILAGREHEFTEPFDLRQAWHELLSEKSSVRQQTAIINMLPTTGVISYISFEQLEIESTVLAQHLLTHFGRPAQGGDWIIAVCLPPSIELIISLLAIFKAGAAYLPLDPAFPKNRVAHICTDANPSLFLTSTAVLNDCNFDGLEEIPTVFLVDSYLLEIGEESTSPQYKPIQQDLAAVLYTSGSTGTPKGVRLTHFNILNRLNWQWRSFPFTAGEVGCFKTALTFVDSIAEIWAPLLKGIPIVIIPKIVTQNPQLFVETLSKFRVTRLVLVPSLLSSILENTSEWNNKGILNSLRLWICSGEVLPVQLLHKFYENFNGVVCNFYGSTEITGDVTFAVFRCKEDVDSTLLEGRVPLGKPLDNCTIYVLDSMGEPVERGKSGEIFISGAHVADGYVNKSNVTNSFVPNNILKKKGHAILYRTGDYGKIVNNQLYYDGRADSQVKVRGHRVNLTEINSVLNQLDQVEKSVVLCWKPGQPEQEILAFVMSNINSSATADESVHRKLKERLVSYAMPRILMVKDIPLLVNGKVDRQSLIRYYEKHCRNKSVAFQWDENELQLLEEKTSVGLARALFKTVSLVLGGSLQKPLSLMDNFFYVGGNSLNAVIVVTKLRDQGIQLEVGDFLEAENFGQIVRLMENCNSTDDDESQRIGLHSAKYKTGQLKSVMKPEVIRILSECFAEKGDLSPYTGVTCQDYATVIDEIWEPILSENLSFVVKNDQNQIIACGINCDLYNPPVVYPKSKRVGYIFELSSALKAPFRESLIGGKKGHVLQNFLVATDLRLSPAENVAVVEYIERETVLLAERNGFKIIITSNSSALTQQICDDILNYEILFEYQVNQFVTSDGAQPFATAPDSFVAKVSVKYL